MDFAVRFHTQGHYRGPNTGHLTVADDVVSLAWREPLLPVHVSMWIMLLVGLGLLFIFPMALMPFLLFYDFQLPFNFQIVLLWAFGSAVLFIFVNLIPLRRKHRTFTREEISALCIHGRDVTFTVDNELFLLSFTTTADTNTAVAALREGTAEPRTWRYSDMPETLYNTTRLPYFKTEDITVADGTLTVVGVLNPSMWRILTAVVLVYACVLLPLAMIGAHWLISPWLLGGLIFIGEGLLGILTYFTGRSKREMRVIPLAALQAIDTIECHVTFLAPDGDTERRYTWLLQSEEEAKALATRLHGVGEPWKGTLPRVRGSVTNARLHRTLPDALTVPGHVTVTGDLVTITGHSGLRAPQERWWAFSIAAVGYAGLAAWWWPHVATLALPLCDRVALGFVAPFLQMLLFVFLPAVAIIHACFMRGIRLPRRMLHGVQKGAHVNVTVRGGSTTEIIAASEADARALCAALTPAADRPTCTPSSPAV